MARCCLLLLLLVADSLVEDAVVNEGDDRLRASAFRRASLASNVVASIVSLLSVVDCNRVVFKEEEDVGFENAPDR